MDMKINSSLRAYEIPRLEKPASANARVSRAEEQKDMVALSSHAKDYRNCKKALSSVPDIRQDKVSALKKTIEEGAYDVPAADIAEKIFANLQR
ncbi:MAG: flagellar biosynthesis anti-sigma factor FlgM [Clostridiales bacterium]|jgi:flagellar biosynthesis anti-sigma factor FlgM|nr:flagellar biosynthesis anti-sigma factor FlgM [Clostridiales bacterium]